MSLSPRGNIVLMRLEIPYPEESSILPSFSEDTLVFLLLSPVGEYRMNGGTVKELSKRGTPSSLFLTKNSGYCPTVRKPRLLYILHAYQNQGGTEEHTKLLASALSDEFDCFLLFPEGERLFLIHKGQVVGEYSADPFEWPLTPHRSAKTDHSLREVLQSLQPSIVHVQHFFKWPLGIFELLRAEHQKTVVTFHDYYALTPEFTMRFLRSRNDLLSPEYSRRVFGQDFSQQLRERREYLEESLQAMNVLLSPSSFLRREIVRDMAKLEIRVLEHGIVPFKVLPHVSSDHLRFTYLGGIISQKGYRTLLRAFDVVHRKYPTVELSMYGVAADPPPVKGGGFEYRGTYDRDSLPRILSHSDVVIIPSEFGETYSLVLSELWHAKVSPLVSYIGVFTERVTNEKNGKFFIPGNVGSLATEIEWFINNVEWRNWIYPSPRLANEMVEEYRLLYRSIL
jgi:glycosyltransferase involved in cell wall biosynthesis